MFTYGGAAVRAAVAGFRRRDRLEEEAAAAANLRRPRAAAAAVEQLPLVVRVHRRRELPGQVADPEPETLEALFFRHLQRMVELAAVA
jgi:hypothetical protein